MSILHNPLMLWTALRSSDCRLPIANANCVCVCLCLPFGMCVRGNINVAIRRRQSPKQIPGRNVNRSVRSLRFGMENDNCNLAAGSTTGGSSRVRACVRATQPRKTTFKLFRIENAIERISGECLGKCHVDYRSDSHNDTNGWIKCRRRRRRRRHSTMGAQSIMAEHSAHISLSEMRSNFVR